jgi:RNA polymerase sigma-70 factor (ECF subfamily)
MNRHFTTEASPDESLMLEFCKGSREAFGELFHRYKQPIFGYFCRRVTERAQAEELTQETFLALYRASGRYQVKASFRTYVYAVAMKVLQAHRRKANFRSAFWGASEKAAGTSARDATESNLWVREALAKLGAVDREMLMLREFEQLSYGEIAELLKLPLNTVRSRLFRARMALRELLEPDRSAARGETGVIVLAEKGERA